ncbi:Tripartite-type tricarboxylate transporter, receptor component TctC [Geosporobacter subterraneus DSM 17957]|uniref:Tripartite-type tricarboxylate transporter, receptor component TctC n=1 Tax=Geosporobacter subterraneus DSM 17957 TaxID=1121919 RepID=A0A1M6EQR5_9FIRM|nr:tripartite tricarboxylate transporter substrate binding protein [Geosporobacter subterraneus]SHI87610.1 Tripartite-type tricarboxylate transporter, receptor component TctC [Geosporobacter subterraneus DSM 17957]
MRRKIALFLTLVLVFTVVATGCTKPQQAAQEAAPKVDFPKQGITAICPWAAGGGTDAVLRGLTLEAEKILGQTITVVNQTGGGGAIGHSAIMKAKPDGYTVGMITFELNSLPPQGLVPFTYKDFDPLMRINMDAAALTVKKDAPYNTIEEFVAYAKQHPGEINIGNSAPGSVWHIAAGLMAEKTGIQVEYVPFEGAAPAVTALVGGHIEAVSVSVPEVIGQVEAGDLKILGVMSAERLPSIPDVPTFKESGIDVVFGTWRGLAVPKGTPDEVKQILMDGFKQAYDSQGFQDFAKNAGLGLAYQDAAEYAKFLEANANDVAEVMKKLGLAK